MQPSLHEISFLTDHAIYKTVILEAIPEARRFLWLATADLKDLHIHKAGNMVPFLEKLSELVSVGVEIRLLHAKEPGPAFRKDFDRYPNLIDGIERILCPRVHFKSVVVDGRFAYSGSANLTGAGMGAKSRDRRNFESGFITRSTVLIREIMDQFDRIWMGEFCRTCGRKRFCADYADIESAAP